MAAPLDFTHLSPQERLDLIEALWDSLDAKAITLTETQGREIDSRLAMLDAHPNEGRDAFEVLAELRGQTR